MNKLKTSLKGTVKLAAIFLAFKMPIQAMDNEAPSLPKKLDPCSC